MMTLAAIIAVTTLALLAVFQLLLALGAPLGSFAWGGQHRILPVKLRIGSLVSIAIYAVFAALILSASSIWAILPNGAYLDIVLWILFAYTIVGTIMNAASRSKPERYTMTPMTLLRAVSIFIVAAH